jgi:hypothetical protein
MKNYLNWKFTFGLIYISLLVSHKPFFEIIGATGIVSSIIAQKNINCLEHRETFYKKNLILYLKLFN